MDTSHASDAVESPGRDAFKACMGIDSVVFSHKVLVNDVT